MVRSGSLFSQLLVHFPRTQFASLSRQHQAERHAKGFGCWTQFVAMCFCHLARADSLREICNGLACCLGKLTHLGIDRAPKKSTLAYANQHRPASFFEALFGAALATFRAEGRLGGRGKSKFRFKNKLLLLDSTTITLCLSLFPWARFRSTKGGVKLHVLLDQDDAMPAYCLISEARRADVRVAPGLSLKAGSIVVMDRAYNDYRLFGGWCDQGVYFVTRMKERTAYEVVEERPVPQGRTILADEILQLNSEEGRRSCPHRLRRVVVWDEQGQREIVLLTNHLDFGATTLAAIYRERWQIELFFEALKQNLKIRTFVGTTENALRIQIWTALIAMLLLRWLHHLSRAQWSLSNLAAMLRLNLFTYRDLTEWLHDPFHTPPNLPEPQQLGRDLPDLGQLI